MRVFTPDNEKEVKKIMHDIGVDPYGVKIMLPKALNFLIHLKNINNIAANILKQEMLSLGADAAVARGALTGKVKKTDVLIIGSLSQFDSLKSKLKLQPFGLKQIGEDIEKDLLSYTRDNFVLRLRGRSLHLGRKTHIMGIINLTPDSFSGDGLYRGCGNAHVDLALRKAEQMAQEGADIIDLGGQSSRPGAKSVSTKEELRRIKPVVKLLVKKINLPVSIDTFKPEVADAALDAGAQIINDVSGLRDKSMVRLAVKYKAAVVIMHMLGKPVNMQKNISYRSLIDDITAYLKRAVDSAHSLGVMNDKIIIDPGIGFGKTTFHNLQILKRLADFKVLGKPILIGTSRKSFIANLLGDTLENRVNGTLASCVIAAQNGANILRVHDVGELSRSLKMVEAIKNADR
ncbi:MAG: dihydropteroate synthase [Candidatus Omnitrophica bacterium]|jgi:dihydropteroate synthase|nr:dihydropteroate synthase [Candidatus Omnitrophota bacterium]MDD5661063.1 dihydropteroate synthase [Candidatus Omnitrophota bacterium]